MPNETKGDPSGLPIQEAEYYEAAPEFHVGSWSPSPAGTPPAQYIKPSQVHVRVGTPPGFCALVRIKSGERLDEIIDALYLHREDVWGRRGGRLNPVLDMGLALTLLGEVLLEGGRVDAQLLERIRRFCLDGAEPVIPSKGTPR